MKKIQGFSLIELIIFIVVIGLVMSGIFISFTQVLSKITFAENNNIATQLARERMEIILGQRFTSGFATFTDPCSGGTPSSICGNPTGFTVSSSITTNANINYKTITVNVTGRGYATLIMQVANY